MSPSWRYRKDGPGTLQFVTIKGVGGLPVFGRREDARYLLSLLAREVRAGAIAIFCFSFVVNHVHLLFLSPHGRIWVPLKRALERFARYYNRTRGRSGHVFQDRFHSVRIDTEASFLCVVGYIDGNLVRAGLSELATDYEFGSAFHMVRTRAPLWLDRARVLAYVPGASERGFADRKRYLQVFGKMDIEFIDKLLERRKCTEQGLDDPLDAFLGPHPASRRAWMRRQSLLADGTEGARMLAKPKVLREVWEERSAAARSLLVGLLRLACACSYREIGAIVGISHGVIAREVRRHRERLRESAAYFEAADEVLTEAVRRSFSFLPRLPEVGPDGVTRR